MHRQQLQTIFARRVLPGAAALFLALGCSSPDKVNIALRKQNEDQRAQIESLQRTHVADLQSVRAAQAHGGSTLPTLPQDRVDKLYIAQGLKLERLTGGAKLSPNAAADDGIKVYVVPTDQDGQQIKASGSFTIELFDLANSAQPLVGKWQFTTDQARQLWYGSGLLYCYVLPARWEHPPAHSELTVRVSFVDELTRRDVAPVQKIIKVNLSGAPGTQPVTGQ